MNLVFIKIHKCSSTSVTNLLEDFSVKNNLKYVVPKMLRRGIWYRLSNSSDEEKALADKYDYWDLTNPPYNIFARHQAYDVRFFNSFMATPFCYITFLRHPLERAVSCYFSSNVPPKPILPFVKWYNNEETLDQIPSDDSHDSISNVLKQNSNVLKHNFMSYMAGFDSLEEITTENLKKRYKFIGFTEHFNESIKKLEGILGWKFNQKLLFKKARENKDKPEINLSEKFKKKFRENNLLDFKLYKLSKELYL